MGTYLFGALVLSLLCGVKSFEFKKGDDNVNFGEVASGIQQLNMDENNEPPTVIVVVTGAANQPTLNFDDGERSLFNPTVVQNGQEWNIVANSKIDFEQMAGGRFLVAVNDGTGEKLFNLRINNLDDESPTIVAGPCIMRENTTINLANTNCSYQIHDPDGFLSSIRFNIVNSEGKQESDIFEFQYKSVPLDNVKDAVFYMILKPGIVLDFEETTLWIFQLKARDGGDNPSIPETVQIVVQVEDIADMPPVWTNVFAMATLDEKTKRTFTVVARDGDYQINNPINYRVDDSTGYVTVNAETGEITVDNVDRDAGFDTVEVIVTAFEVPDPEWINEQKITFLINDIDDQIPEIKVDGSVDKLVDVSIDENSNDPLTAVIMVNDRDLGANAMYTASFHDDEGHSYSSAFQIVPSRGFSQTNLSIAIVNSRPLDYEDPEWRIITFTLVTVGDLTSTNTDSLSITIRLIDLNDEVPEFETDGYTVTVPEDVAKDEVIATVLATDKDEGDVVSHSLLGTMANNILVIDRLTGKVSTKIEGAFDYEKQSEVLIQIRAEDLAEHVAVTQLTIIVTDVNDEDPRMTVSSAVTVDENRPDGTEIDVEINATDEDTDPNLEFSILWDRTYAMKNSVRLPNQTFEPYVGCVEVKTVKETENSREAQAKLTIKEVLPNNTPDYELFDTLFLALQVTDKNTVHGKGFDTATILINIGNLNDNDPEFTQISKTINRTVIDGAAISTSVGSVTAVDVDNLFKLQYSIKPTDDTPDWIEINEETGDLSVKEIVDCDEHKIFYLNYTISVTDGERSKSLEISVYIIDFNDNQPVMTEVYTHLVEGSDAVVVYTFNATDADRDEPYNLVQYQPPTSGLPAEITNRFKIDNDNLMVNLQNGAKIEWTKDTTQYVFSIDCVDNPLQVSTSQPQYRTNVRVTLIIDDINDKEPIISTTKLSAREDLKEGGKIQDIVAVDEDSEGPNSEVAFSILEVRRFDDENYSNEIGTAADYLDLFHIETDEEHKTKIAALTVTKDLKGLYGYFKLIIQTNDFGKPPNFVDNTVSLVVQKFNFEDLSFVFPSTENIIYLSTEQDVDGQLRYYNGAPLENLRATDHQGEKFDIKFDISHQTVNDAMFTTKDSDSFGRSQGQLQLVDVKDIREKEDYIVNLIGYIPGGQKDITEKPYNITIRVPFRFFNLNEDPLFDVNSVTVQFQEGPEGPKEVQSIPKASYEDVGIPDLPIFYLVGGGDGRDTFDVDKTTGDITIKKDIELDYETKTSYELTIQSSRRDATPDPDANEKTQLRVTINVIDINDNPPIFEKQAYYGLVRYNYPISTSILQVHAIDADVNDVIRYVLDTSSFSASGTGLSTTNPFQLNEQTGVVSLTSTFNTNMNGYFTFTIYAIDPAPEYHNDTTEVAIYIMTPDNCVNFKFENKLVDVLNKTENIKQKLSEEFKYRTTMEAPEADKSASGTSLANQTIAPVYFIDETTQKPILQGVILKRVTDITVFTRLRQTFLEDQLYLMSFDSNSDGNGNLEEVLRAWLIGVSVVLGALCLILLVAFILRTRALNQRISNLSNTKFGSQESGLNRQGIAAPTTNKHALEGSNPVYNNNIDTKEIDRRSIASGDSDLIGVEDNPEFAYEDDFGKTETTD